MVPATPIMTSTPLFQQLDDFITISETIKSLKKGTPSHKVAESTLVKINADLDASLDREADEAKFDDNHER